MSRVLLVADCYNDTLLQVDPAIRYLQQNDRSYHRNDDHYHCHGQQSPVFLASRVLSCLKFLIPCGPLCGPSCLLLLSGFLGLPHVLPLSPVPCGALHKWGVCTNPHRLSNTHGKIMAHIAVISPFLPGSNPGETVCCGRSCAPQQLREKTDDTRRSRKLSHPPPAAGRAPDDVRGVGKGQLPGV